MICVSFWTNRWPEGVRGLCLKDSFIIQFLPKISFYGRQTHRWNAGSARPLGPVSFPFSLASPVCGWHSPGPPLPKKRPVGLILTQKWSCTICCARRAALLSASKLTLAAAGIPEAFCGLCRGDSGSRWQLWALPPLPPRINIRTELHACPSFSLFSFSFRTSVCSESKSKVIVCLSASCCQRVVPVVLWRSPMSSLQLWACRCLTKENKHQARSPRDIRFPGRVGWENAGHARENRVVRLWSLRKEWHQ